MSFTFDAPTGASLGLRPARLISYQNVGIIAAIIDCVLIVGASIAAGFGYHLVALGYVSDVRAFVGIGSNAAFLFVLLAKSQEMYRPPALLSPHVGRIAVSWSVVLLAIVLLLFLMKLGESYSRGAAIGFGMFGLGLLLGSRAVFARVLKNAVASREIQGQRALIIGEPQELAYYSANHLSQMYGFREIARFELPADQYDEPPLLAADRVVLGAAINAAQVKRAEVVLVALRWRADVARYDFVRECLRMLPLPALLLPDRSVRSILSHPMVEMGSEFVVELQRAPMTLLELAIKRVVDVLVAGSLLVLISPLLALVGIAIKLDSRGPVIFRQHRNGFNGRQFTIYKFRTMKVSESGVDVRQARRNDDRVTNLGFFLRRTSIDELPQLFNVLTGDMSLVGPRPHAVAHDDEYSKLIAKYAFRNHVKPGITGWAQISGFRGETARLELMERRVELDLWYIDNWTIWLDFWILIRTCIVVPRSSNAY